MAKLITTIFASSGDKTYPPLTATDGSVNLTTGYTDQYEIDLSSGDPTAKAVERDVMNGLFSWLFENQSFDQAHGIAPWFSAYTGGYPLNALVADNSTGTWQIYRSLVDGNTAITTATGSWEALLTQTEILNRIPFALGGASGSANGALTNGSSLNSWAYSQGVWVVPTDAIAASLTNCPSTRQGVLIARNTTVQYNPSTTTTGGSFFQLYIDANGNFYVRFFAVPSGGSTAAWTSWRTVSYLDSPAFTGVPTAPTAAAGTKTTQIATTAFVANSFAPLASPSLTGVPVAPTAAAGTSTTQLATTEFVTTGIANAGYGRLMGAPKVYVGSGTYTPTSGMKGALIICVGAGGAGGGTPATSSTQNSVAGGGAGGAIVISYLTAAQIGSSVSFTVGAAGVAAAGAAGGKGGNTTFLSVSANGGNGGIAGTAATAAYALQSSTGGAASGGNVSNGNGSPGGMATFISNGAGISGPGGPGLWGAGGGAGGSVSGGGYTNAAGVGGGGGGSAAGPSAAAQAGGAGYYGAIFIYEYA